MGLSNNITAILNLIALLCSIPIISSGIWLSSKADNQCTHYFRWPIVILGTLVLLVSLAGFVGAYWNKQGLLAVYLFCMALLIGLLLLVLVFAFVVTRPDGSFPVPGRACSLSPLLICGCTVIVLQRWYRFVMNKDVCNIGKNPWLMSALSREG